MPSSLVCQNDILTNLLFLIYKQNTELCHSALVELFVEFAFVAAVGGVFLEDIAVAAAEFLQD